MAPVAEHLADRYELGDRLGSGGMGDVYRARDRLLDRPVAVKVPTATITPSSAERFKREARAAARLNHPNIVGVYDWGGGDRPFIVMEFVDGRSLRAVLQDRGRLQANDVATIGAQIADALAHAHHHGVVHRDVKPSNVLLTPRGEVKVTDFGIAQSTTGEALTEPGVVLGTVGYLSPEQVAGLPADARSDVYSLGVVLAELLTGSRPIGDEPEPATELERIVARARATDPGARYQHAAELRDDLRRVAQTAAAPVMAREVSVDTGPTGATDAMGGTGATAPATVGVTTVVMPPAAPPPPKAHRRQKPVKPLKPLKPPKPKRMPRQRTVRPRPARAERAPRRWRASHVAVILAAPLLLLAGGVVAYVKLNEHAPVVAVPDVVDRDVFGAIAAIKHAGFEIEAVAVDSPRPGGIILSQRPANGHELEQGSTVHVTVSRTSATVPDVVGLDVDAARVALAQRGLPNVTLTDDYRDDIDPGTVVSSTPAAGLKSSKGNAIVLVIARDPHVAVPNLVTLDQATAVEQLQARGLEPAIQTASSKTVPAGQVIRVSPSASTVVVRGSTVTLTVSSGPKLVAVPPTVGLERDEAVAKLEDRGFAVVVTTAPSSSDRAGTVMAQSPAGGQAPDGSTVTITVGFGGSKR